MDSSDRISTAVRLPRELHDRLNVEAEGRDVSVNWLVQRAVERALAGWEAQELP